MSDDPMFAMYGKGLMTMHEERLKEAAAANNGMESFFAEAVLRLSKLLSAGALAGAKASDLSVTVPRRLS